MKQAYWHELFEIGVLFKAFNSVWETLGGIFLLTRLHSWLAHFFVIFSRAELLGDRDDFLVHIANTQIQHLNVDSTRTFVGIYLLFHGLMNAFLAYHLYKKHLWSYPVMIVFITTFLVYQLYRLVHTQSLVLLLVTLFDICFIYLTWHEYKYQQKRHAHAKTAE